MPSQIVHGDLAGNVLFSDGLPPAIIDFSPFWRPVGYAEAIVVVDALLDHEEGMEVMMLGRPGGEWVQMLVRALIFRLVAWCGYVEEAKAGVQEGYARSFEKALVLISDRYEQI